MTSTYPTLYNLPASMPMESPSSWITRAALMQGIRVGELLDFLQLDRQGDVDLNVIQADQVRLRAICGLPPEHLDLSLRILSNLLKSGSNTSRFLLSASKYEKPRYRFCTACFREQRIPYLPIHWRFAAFRYCPKHHCMLEDQCGSCGSELIMPASQINAGPKGQGVAYLRQCMSCEADLCQIPRLGTQEAFSLMGSFDQQLMRNGRATLAALLYGHLYMPDEPQRRPLLVLKQLDRQNVLPHDNAWQTTRFLKGKLAGRIRRHAAEREQDIARLTEDSRHTAF